MNNEDKNFQKTNINWYPGHMAKARRELKENMSLVDIVYEVIDARMPISSKVVDIDDIVGNKPRILIVSKYDMCDKKVTDELLNRFDNYEIVKCDLINGNINELLSKTNSILDKINEDRNNKGLLPRKGRVVVIGAPNVGKSTLINKLAGKKTTETGNHPGVTKSLSWTRINDKVELLDSPGILWPKIEDQEVAYNLASLSSIKEEILDIYDITNYIVDKMIKLYPNNLKERYNLEELDKDTIYDDIAKKRGLLSKGANIDYDRVCTTIIQDLKNGKLGNITFDR